MASPAKQVKNNSIKKTLTSANKAKKSIDKQLDSYAKKTSGPGQSKSAPLPQPRRAKTLSVVQNKKKPRGVVKNKPVIKASTKVKKVVPKTNVQKAAEKKNQLKSLKTKNKVKTKVAKKELKAGKKIKRLDKRIKRNT